MVRRNSFMQKYAGSHPFELKFRKETEKEKQFLMKKNTEKYVHCRWNIFFLSDRLAQETKFLYIK